MNKLKFESILLFSSVFYLVFSLFIFGFAFASDHLGIHGEKTYTVSNSLEYGKTEYIVPTLILSCIFTLMLVKYKTKPKQYRRLKLFSIFMIYFFFLLICWYTPSKNNNLHNIFTSFIIVFTSIFLLSIYYYLWKNKYIRLLYYILLIIIIGMFTTGINAVRGERGGIWTDIFAGFEIVLILTYILSLFIFTYN